MGYILDRIFYNFREVFLACVLIALVVTILLFIFILPDSRRAKLNKFGRMLADIFNFRSLLIEQIFKFTYIFITCLIILTGAIILTERVSVGLLVMILGPVIYRVLYEFFMVFIILVKNTTDINKKMSFQKKEEVKKDVQQTAPKKDVQQTTPKKDVQQTTTEKPANVYTANNANVCPKCQANTSEEHMFCEHCGYKLK